MGALPGSWLPPAFFPGHDFLSQLLTHLGVMDLVFHPIIGWIFTLFLIGSSIGMIARPKSRWPFINGIFGFSLYMLAYNTALGHFYHSLIGLPILMLPFLFKDKKSYRLAWEFARYYLLYIMVSAALWKIFRGAAFQDGHLTKTLFQQNAFHWIQSPNSITSLSGKFLFEHPSLANLAFAILILFQLSFVVGFFSRAFDKYLGIGLILFFCLNSLIMGINSWPLIVFLLPLIGSRQNLSAKFSAKFI
jgi:hypothetical protein